MTTNGDKPMTTETINPADVILRHDTKLDRLDDMIESLEERGWDGRPVVVYEVDGELRNITGCHRLDAAALLGLDEVPALVLRPTTSAQIDEIEFAASSDDIDAASILRRAGYAAAADLVEQG